jgi:hypothetical protein
MLFDGEGSGVELDTEDADIGEDSCPESTAGEDEELGDNL